MNATYTKNNYQNIILKMKRCDEKMPDPSFLNHIFKRMGIVEKELRTLKLTSTFFSISPEQKLNHE